MSDKQPVCTQTSKQEMSLVSVNFKQVDKVIIVWNTSDASREWFWKKIFDSAISDIKQQHFYQYLLKSCSMFYSKSALWIVTKQARQEELNGSNPCAQ